MAVFSDDVFLKCEDGEQRKSGLNIHIIKDFDINSVDQSGSYCRCLYLCIWLWQKVIVEEIYMLK